MIDIQRPTNRPTWICEKIRESALSRVRSGAAKSDQDESLEGDNTFEGDVESDVTPRGGVDPDQTGLPTIGGRHGLRKPTSSNSVSSKIVRMPGMPAKISTTKKAEALETGTGSASWRRPASRRGCRTDGQGRPPDDPGQKSGKRASQASSGRLTCWITNTPDTVWSKRISRGEGCATNGSFQRWDESHARRLWMKDRGVRL